MKPISVQLYALREESARDFLAVLQSMADIGYSGVEPFNLFGLDPTEFKKIVEDLGMQVSSSHHPWANRSSIAELVDTVSALGLTRAAAGFGPDDVKDGNAVKQTVETINSLTEELAQHDLQLFLHNHWWEFIPVEGELPYHTFYRECPLVQFEVDTYWASNFGACNVPDEVARVRSRAPLLHIKDGPLEQNKAHVAVGQGKMDIRGTIAAADPDVLEWVIVELDACDTDMTAAIAESYSYLTEEGLAQGTK